MEKDFIDVVDNVTFYGILKHKRGSMPQRFTLTDIFGNSIVCGFSKNIFAKSVSLDGHFAKVTGTAYYGEYADIPIRVEAHKIRQDKQSISADCLQFKIDTLLKSVGENLKPETDEPIDTRESIYIVLDEDDALYQHMCIKISTWKDAWNSKLLLNASVCIKGLAINDIESMKDLEILKYLDKEYPIQLINELIFEDIEFHYREKSDNSEMPTSLMISANKCNVVKIINCATKNHGSLRVRYNMPAEYATENKLTIKNCNFYHFSIIAMSIEDISSRNDIKNQRALKSSNEILYMNLSVVLDGNTFNRATLKLTNSPSDEYEYEYDAMLINENDIEELIISDEYPAIISWGTHERIGGRIAKNYNTMPKRVESPQNKAGIIACVRYVWIWTRSYNIDETIKDKAYKSAIKLAWDKINCHKIIFIRFKKLAADKGDKFQESTINYHIAKCDEQFMSLETDRRFVQDKVIMAFGRELSYHGTSWILPLLWISTFNLSTGIIIFAIIDLTFPLPINNLDLLYIVGELFNPLSTPLSIVEAVKEEEVSYKSLGYTYTVLAISVLLSKAFYAMCIYEFVRAARRFTLK